MSDFLEDEDIIPEYSPLNEFLSTTDSLKFEESKNENIQQINKDINLSMIRLLILDKFFAFDNFIKRKIFEKPISDILNLADKINVLTEYDEMCLHYLIQSRSIHWSSMTNNKSVSNFQKVICLFIVLSLFFIFFGKFVAGFFLIFSLIIYVLFLIIYGFFIRWLIGIFLDNLVILSTQSRQTILLVQEILSLDQGFSKIVHLKDSSIYDCSKSFNEDFLEYFINRIFSILFDLFSHMEKFNNNILTHVKISKSIIEEIPWIHEKFQNILDFDFRNFNFRQPISQLKNLHNSVQLQFSELLKMIILLLYYFNNHPNIFLSVNILCLLHKFHEIRQHFMKFKEILQMKTKSNLSKCISDEIVVSKVNNDNFKNIKSAIQRLDLHLFELSEFSSQLSEGFEINKIRTESLCEYLGLQLNLIEKSKKHIDGIKNSWDGLCEEISEIINYKSKSDDSNNIEYKIVKKDEKCEDVNEIVIDNFPEILDEVIEGIPEDRENDVEKYLNQELIDPFEERYATNAKDLLNELQSVIEVRAKDWKKREKLALKRRAAEGKFVFNTESQHIKDFDDLNSESSNERCDIKCLSSADQVNFELDFRKSLGEMILKQRHVMLSDSKNFDKTEECFED